MRKNRATKQPCSHRLTKPQFKQQMRRKYHNNNSHTPSSSKAQQQQQQSEQQSEPVVVSPISRLYPNMSSSPLHQQRNHHNSNNPYLPPWMSPRQRTFAVILLCGMTMVGCFVRFGSLPREESGEGLLLANHKSRDTTKHQTTKNDWWADDDETAFTGDDDFYNKKEKRVRGGQKKNTNNNTKGAYNNIDNDATEQEPKKPSKQLPVLPTASDAKDKTSISVSSPQPILGNNKESRPGIVWLMSYPNSGTSYTMTAVAKATNRATASNYGREVTDPPETNVPLYPGQWDGPFYRPDPERPLPEDYIMVKTHCGGTF